MKCYYDRTDNFHTAGYFYPITWYGSIYVRIEKNFFVIIEDIEMDHFDFIRDALNQEYEQIDFNNFNREEYKNKIMDMVTILCV